MHQPAYSAFFFFQAEDGIRDADVTGVQTCALPISRLRPRTMSFVDGFFLCRVFLPSTLPQGDAGGRPPDVLPSPPPSGWSTGFIATPRTRGLRPSQRVLPAFPIESSSCSAFDTSPMVARHSPRTIRISVERSRRVT